MIRSLKKMNFLLGIILFSMICVGCQKEFSFEDTVVESIDFYVSYSFDVMQNVPHFIGEEYNLGYRERRYDFITDFLDLMEIFEYSTGVETKEYWNEDIFIKNVVLCVVRDETAGTANIKYSNFKANGNELSIKETFISGGAEVVSRYLDFVVLPKELLSSIDINGEAQYSWKTDYYWEK